MGDAIGVTDCDEPCEAEGRAGAPAFRCQDSAGCPLVGNGKDFNSLLRS